MSNAKVADLLDIRIEALLCVLRVMETVSNHVVKVRPAIVVILQTEYRTLIRCFHLWLPCKGRVPNPQEISASMVLNEPLVISAIRCLIMADEFDCCECGRHIVALPYDVMGYRMCAACMSMPGWWKLPGVARAIDPEHDRTVKDDE